MWIKCVAMCSQTHMAESYFGHMMKGMPSKVAVHFSSNTRHSRESVIRSKFQRGRVHLYSVVCMRIEHGDLNLRQRSVQNLGRQVTVTTKILFFLDGVQYLGVFSKKLRVCWGSRNSEFASKYLEKFLHTSVRRLPLRGSPFPLHSSPSLCHPTLQ